MPEYRLYCLKRGKIINASTYEAADDAAALKLATERFRFVDVEVWSGARFVAEIPGGGPPILKGPPL